jgi:VWFA-related protein
MIPRTLLSLILILTNVPLVFTQQPAPPLPQKPATPAQNPPEIEPLDVVRISANLVQVDAVVTKDGKQVADLTADDFELFEDGKPQTITNFSYISNVSDATAAPPAKPSAKDNSAPVPPAVVRTQDVRRTIALVVDDLGMSFQSVADAQRNLRKFINGQLAPNDLVAIIHTSGEVGALQQFTSDRRMLTSAIDRLRWFPCSRTGFQVFAQVSTMQPPAEAISLCGGTRSLMEYTLRALKFIVEGMRELPGRKSLVLMSDSLPIETQEPATSIVTPGEVLADVRTDYTGQLKKVAEMAIRSSVVIYTVDTRGLVYTGLTAADPLFTPGALASAHPPVSTMRQVISNQSSTMNARSSALNSGREGADLIARQTGGFLVQNSNDFGLKRVAEDQNGYYLLAYRPTEQTFNKQFHHIKLTVKPKGLTVRTRNGFLGVGDTEKPAPLTTTDQLAKALISPFGANDINVRLTTMFTSVETGALLRSLLYIDAKDLVFRDEPDGGHVATFDLGMILFGENGRVVDQQKREVKVHLNKERYQNALQSGLVYTLETPMKQAGAFQYRVALRDQASSRIGSAGQFIQIPNLANGQMVLSGLVVQKDVPETAVDAGSQFAREAISAGPAVRQFHQGDTLLFAFLTFNAQQHVASHLPLASQTRIFRDGKLVLSRTPSAIDAAQGDPRRIPSVGRLQLGAEFTPGQYVLQIVISDPSAKEKRPLASQWIDFEIVK